MLFTNPIRTQDSLLKLYENYDKEGKDLTSHEDKLKKALKVSLVGFNPSKFSENKLKFLCIGSYTGELNKVLGYGMGCLWYRAV